MNSVSPDPTLLFFNPEYFEPSQPIPSPEPTPKSPSKRPRTEEEIPPPKRFSHIRPLPLPLCREIKKGSAQWEKIAYLFTPEYLKKLQLPCSKPENARKWLNRFLQIDQHPLQPEEGYARTQRRKWAKAGMFQQIGQLLPELQLNKIHNLIPPTCREDSSKAATVDEPFKELKESQWLRVQHLFSKRHFKSLDLSFEKPKFYLTKMLDHLLNHKKWHQVKSPSRAKDFIGPWRAKGILSGVAKILPELGLTEAQVRPKKRHKT